MGSVIIKNCMNIAIFSVVRIVLVHKLSTELNSIYICCSELYKACLVRYHASLCVSCERELSSATAGTSLIISAMIRIICYDSFFPCRNKLQRWEGIVYSLYLCNVLFMRFDPLCYFMFIIAKLSSYSIYSKRLGGSSTCKIDNIYWSHGIYSWTSKYLCLYYSWSNMLFSFYRLT